MKKQRNTRHDTAAASADAAMPQAVESEKNILGAILLSEADALRRIFAAVRPEYFYSTAHRLIFEAAHAVYEQYQTADVDMVARELEARGHEKETGGMAALGSIVEQTVSTATTRGHIQILIEAWRRRFMIAMIEAARGALLSNSTEARGDLLNLYGNLGLALYDATKKPLTWKTADHYLENEPPPLNPVFTERFDVGDKVAIISSSKAGKTFFILQMALALSAGQDFLGWENPGGKRRKVMLVQFEVQEAHYWRRLQAVSRLLHIDPTDADFLRVYCARGTDMTGTEFLPKLEADAIEFGAEVVILDPLYKLMAGGENAAEDMKPILLAFDRLAERAGVTVVYVHHDAKGTPGDRALSDRGSGSGVIGRDYDAAIVLTRHATENKATVVETLLRNYPDPEPFSIGFQTEDGLGFWPRPDLPAVKKTSMNGSKAPGVMLDALLPAIREVIPDGAVPVARLQMMIDRLPGMTLRKRQDAMKLLEAEGELMRRRIGKGDSKGVVHMIGTPEAIAELEKEN